MRKVYKFPSAKRPEKFFKRIDEIVGLSRTEDYEIIATLDIEDATMFNRDVIEKMNSYPQLTHYFGSSMGKCGSCNRDLELLTEYDILFLQSDDMQWTTPGFDSMIEQFVQRHCTDTDFVIHVPDQITHRKLITYSIAGREYINRTGYIYYPEYKNVYADNEFTEVSQILGKYHFMDGLTVTHNHPIFGLSEWDDQYIQNESPESYDKDRQLFNERQSKRFYL